MRYRLLPYRRNHTRSRAAKSLVVPDKSERVYHFHQETIKALQEIVEAAGLQHPAQINTRHIVRRVSANEVRLLEDLLPDVPPGALLKNDEGLNLPKVFQLYWDVAQADSFNAKHN